VPPGGAWTRPATPGKGSPAAVPASVGSCRLALIPHSDLPRRSIIFVRTADCRDRQEALAIVRLMADPSAQLPDPRLVAPRLPVSLQARYPEIHVVFADLRKFAEEWTYRFLAAALAGATGAGVE
jgi:hypothetical protein